MSLRHELRLPARNYDLTLVQFCLNLHYGELEAHNFLRFPVAAQYLGTSFLFTTCSYNEINNWLQHPSTSYNKPALLTGDCSMRFDSQGDI